jgi:flagellar motility protein MotE (MotC chaperone)
VEFDAESRGVRELVEVLRRRDEELARRDADLKRREAAIAAAAKDLNEKIVHLESLTGTTPSVVPSSAPSSGGPVPPAAGRPAGGGTGDGNGTGAAVDAMEELGKIYGAMKAEEAAPLFDRLDDATVLRIFRHMKQRQISAVLPLMKPEKAVVLTELLGGRKPPPETTRAATHAAPRN